MLLSNVFFESELLEFFFFFFFLKSLVFSVLAVFDLSFYKHKGRNVFSPVQPRYS